MPPGIAAWLAAAVLLAASMPALGQEEGQRDPIRAEFWIDLEPVAKVGEDWPASPEEAAQAILDEASWVIAGLIWGYEFAYTPLDRVRGIREKFELQPLGSIPHGDPRLVPGPARNGSARMRAFIEYRPDVSQSALMASYGREPWMGAQGIGRADVILGWRGRRAAYEDSLREALRSLLRSLEPNKPRLVRGRVAFERVPTIAQSGGSYTVQARVRAQVLEVLPYTVY